MSSGGGTYWPSMSDYQEAVQLPSLCFTGPELKQSTAVTNQLGLPRPICGQFASVYELTNGGRWAVKCFLRNIPDQHNRYAKISSHLKSCGLPYFVTFEYQAKGILVQGKLFPVVKMEWAQGLTLNEYIEQNLSNTGKIQALEPRWVTLLEDLRAAKIGHGDLQHGNVLVAPDDSLRLIDYDGMWVPKLKGEESHETGHPDYQSPMRTGKDFHADIDDFAGELIHISLRALSIEPGLWQKYNTGENLLFKRQDYVNPAASEIFKEVRALGDKEIRKKLDFIIAACGNLRKAAKLRSKQAEAALTAAAASAAYASQSAADKASSETREAAAPKAVPQRPTRRWAGKRVGPALYSLSRRAKAVVSTAPAAQPKPAPPAPRPKPSAPAPAPPRKSTGTWLDDHVSAYGAPEPQAAAAAPNRSPFAAASGGPAVRAATPTPTPSATTPPTTAKSRRRLYAFLRYPIHLLVVGSLAYVCVYFAADFPRWGGDLGQWLVIIASGAMTLLGTCSLLSLIAKRHLHRLLSLLFFGILALLMFLNIGSELVADRTYGLTGDDPRECALMVWLLVSSIGAIVIEQLHRRHARG